MKNKVKNNHTYIIAEAGQNHNGQFDKAINLIDIAAITVGHYGNEFKADAIKFCKRELSEELTDDAWNAPYNSPHSYGETYGEHRKALELSYEQHAELFLYAKKKGLDFVETICSPGALRLLKWFRPDFIKVASRDMNNIPLLEAIARVDVPIILSSGMSDIGEIERAVIVISEHQKNISILHCVSQYPARYENINLQSVKLLKKFYEHEKYVIGYSDHTSGVLAPSIAVMGGAQIIEKHITYDRKAKGNDHEGSMDISGFERVVRDIRNTELAMGQFKKDKPKGIEQSEKKLRRSICLKRDIRKGEIIQESDLIMLSPGTGMQPGEAYKIIGHPLTRDVKARTILQREEIG